MRNPFLPLLLVATTANAYFDPDRSLPQKMKIALNNFLLDQFDMDVIRTEVKVSLVVLPNSGGYLCIIVYLLTYFKYDICVYMFH